MSDCEKARTDVPGETVWLDKDIDAGAKVAAVERHA